MAVLAAGALAWPACGATAGATSASAAAAAASSRAVPAQAPVLLVLGDSLSAEYGLRTGEGWVHLLEQRLAQRRTPWRVVNASISGETTAGGRTRLPALLATHHPRLVVVELGANDALRGSPLAATRQNLDAMVAVARKSGAQVLLVGLQVPSNYGRQYQEDFARVFTDAAKAGHVPLVPFLLKGIADRPDADAWFQADGIHPVARAHPLMLENVWTVLQPMLGR